MTHDEFKRLPLLLTRRQVLQALGVTSRTLARLVDSGALVAWHSPIGGAAASKPSRARYPKAEVARLAKLPL